MHDLDQLTDFLEQKSFTLRQEIGELSDYFSRAREAYNNQVEVLNAAHLQFLIDSQRQVNELVKCLLFLGSLNNRAKTKGEAWLEEEIAYFIQGIFEETIDGTRPYHQEHLLYGYEPFRKLLLQHYISVEDYEMCQKFGTL